jgi:hypothetical protein
LVVVPGAIGVGRAILAWVVLRPNAVGSVTGWLEREGWPGGLPSATTLPSSAIRVTTIPSVSSEGIQGARCGVVPRKRLGSRRRPIWVRGSGLLL